MTTLFADWGLLPTGWARDVRVTIGLDGRIAEAVADCAAGRGDTHLGGRALLPAPGNLHSHAFQRAMAGLTERRGEGPDSFWTWRELMYRFLATITPEQIEAIAAMAYVEMLEAGFAAVGEFHYVHHAPGGGRYDRPAETGARILAAAMEAGIGLTHLPVLYAYGGAGEAPLSDAQARFGNDLDGYAALVADTRDLLKSAAPDTVFGLAPHSLRATSPGLLAALLDLAGNGPIHIHIAEQQREVAEVEAWLGARPVEWLLQSLPVDTRWCLVHATHMTEWETGHLARSGAVAGLCPITEANLGDGLFPGPAYIGAGGAYGVGSDSNVRISLSGELRLLEYGQRLRDQGRNLMAGATGSTGRALYDAALVGGARALGRPAGRIEAGAWADLLTLDLDAPALVARQGDDWLDGWLFAGSGGIVSDVWSAGRHVVSGGQHVRRDPVRAGFRRVMQALLEVGP